MDTKLAPLHKNKNIALVAHDNMKPVLTDWALKNRDLLANHALYATGTTGFTIEKALNMKIHKFISGPLGGDQQIGAKISEGDIDVLIFFWDPFEPMPHDPDVKALLRLAAAWNIPIASNPASADFLITSPLIGESYERAIPDYERYINERTSSLK
ncbi:methylglyoxal synthase [Agaribacterium haliotis]|uniref:methylglyoxal synthase n=1 Tax=Agaribacterium haliotis TaxID=2013869 RepID=UPI000BB533BA|nr:methylglyoxal synthase [Agaribacterium haliotis]